MHRLFTSLLSILLATCFFSASAQARSLSDRTQFGHDIHVEQGEKTGDVTCFNCSIYVRGETSGDATAFHGRIVLESGASVAGDVTSFLGDVRVEPGTRVAGDLTVMGGSLHRETGAAVAGDVTSFENKAWIVLIAMSPLFVLALLVAFVVWLVQRSRRTIPVAA